MSVVIIILVATLILALIFEFTNGFHDAANVVSTVIATGVLRPFIAISLAAVLNFIGATQISKVAETIFFGIIKNTNALPLIIVSALLSAILWNIITWLYAIPSSSSYALIGGLIGGGLAAMGPSGVLWESIFFNIIVPMICSPIVGYALGLFLMKFFYSLSQRKMINENHLFFSKMQIISSSSVALSHGFNDAQKVMAIITMSLFGAGRLLDLVIPVWIVGFCAFTIALGTFFGGKRIIHTVGFKITHLKPIQGFAAETASSIMIFSAALLGYPLSSTHLITGSIAGVGAAKNTQLTNWKVFRKLIYTWIITIPMTALIAIIAHRLINHAISIFYA